MISIYIDTESIRATNYSEQGSFDSNESIHTELANIFEKLADKARHDAKLPRTITDSSGETVGFIIWTK